MEYGAPTNGKPITEFPVESERPELLVIVKPSVPFPLPV